MILGDGGDEDREEEAPGEEGEEWKVIPLTDNEWRRRQSRDFTRRFIADNSSEKVGERGGGGEGRVGQDWRSRRRRRRKGSILCWT